jgi:hypothetical protein
MAQGNLSPVLVDWRAAVLAGLAAGTLFLILNLVLIPEIIGGTTEVVLRYFASIVLGPGAVSPSSGFGPLTIITAILLHYLLSIIFAFVVAYVVHRWGVVGGTIGGAILGLSIYLINMYTLTLLFPWFFTMENTLFLIVHIIFGAAVGALYEVMERDEYEERQGEFDVGS